MLPVAGQYCTVQKKSMKNGRTFILTHVIRIVYNAKSTRITMLYLESNNTQRTQAFQLIHTVLIYVLWAKFHLNLLIDFGNVGGETKIYSSSASLWSTLD
jgi:hypothetical protein